MTRRVQLWRDACGDGPGTTAQADAQNRTTVGVGPMATVGLLIVSIVMRKGVVPRAVAHLGIAVGVLGIASEALRFVIEGLYGVYGVLLLVWMSAVGRTLFQLGRRVAPPSTERSAPSPPGVSAARRRVP